MATRLSTRVFDRAVDLLAARAEDQQAEGGDQQHLEPDIEIEQIAGQEGAADAGHQQQQKADRSRSAARWGKCRREHRRSPQVLTMAAASAMAAPSVSTVKRCRRAAASGPWSWSAGRPAATLCEKQTVDDDEKRKRRRSQGRPATSCARAASAAPRRHRGRARPAGRSASARSAPARSPSRRQGRRSFQLRPCASTPAAAAAARAARRAACRRCRRCSRS